MRKLKININTKINILIIITVFAVTAGSLLLSVYALNNEGATAIDNYSKAVVSEKKSQIKNLVNTAYTIAQENYKASLDKEQISKEYGDQVKAAVNQAIGVFQSIHNNRSGSGPKQRRKYARLIIDTMRWGKDNKGYFWIQDTDGKMVHHPFKPSLNGEDLIGFKDPDGKRLFKEMDDIIKQHGDGFVSYKWPKPGHDTPVDKISYVKLFKPWNWIIGGGVYLESTEADLKNKSIQTIGSTRYGSDQSGYFFIYDSNGTCILDPVRPENQGKNLFNQKDIKGNSFVRTLIKAASSSDSGGYFTYYLSRPDSASPLPKLSYVRNLKGWDWNIATGVFTDDVDRTIALQRKTVKHDISKAIFKIIIVSVSIVGLFTIIGNIAISKGITRPVRNIIDMLRDIAEGEGDLTKRIIDYSGDETQELAEWFNKFIDNIHKLISKLNNETVVAIGGSITDISATAKQLASSSTEASSTIAQITATAEQVQATAHASNDKAQEISNLSSEMQSAAETSHTCTLDTIKGMQAIKKEMQSVAGNIIKLNEQTMSIGEIIAAVSDLSDQSNLLSVNAAIEAAKAGEYGKGFSVVAQKIMNLADQSKEATEQVRTILNDIQKAANAAVLSTEKSNEAVQEGEKLSKDSGKAIEVLANQVSASGKAARTILSANQQQLEGMDQLTDAMINIKQTIIQNSDGANQLQNASLTLKELGQELEQVTNKFKL